jgi:hypothetical protein
MVIHLTDPDDGNGGSRWNVGFNQNIDTADRVTRSCILYTVLQSAYSAHRTFIALLSNIKIVMFPFM